MAKCKDLTGSAVKRLSNQVSMPAILVTGTTATHNRLFSSLAVVVTNATTHYTYTQRDGQAELAWLAGKLPLVLLDAHYNAFSLVSCLHLDLSETKSFNYP